MQIEGGKSYPVPQVNADECPVSLITEEARAMVEIESMNQHTKRSTNATLFGGDAALWPAVWHDVVTTLQIQRSLDESAYQRSVTHGR